MLSEREWGAKLGRVGHREKTESNTSGRSENDGEGDRHQTR